MEGDECKFAVWTGRTPASESKVWKSGRQEVRRSGSQKLGSRQSIRQLVGQTVSQAGSQEVRQSGRQAVRLRSFIEKFMHLGM